MQSHFIFTADGYALTAWGWPLPRKVQPFLGLERRLDRTRIGKPGALHIWRGPRALDLIVTPLESLP